VSRALIILDEIVRVPLTRGYVATIDRSDIGILKGRDWSALTSPRRTAVYACRVEMGKMLLLHREVIGAPTGTEVDHIDGDGLNCRRSNLRFCTRSQNLQNGPVRSDNRAGLKGAIWDSRAGKWRAEISKDGRRLWLGTFETPEQAHAAYVAAATAEYGEFARAE
jgi:hypothetical protein